MNEQRIQELKNALAEFMNLVMQEGELDEEAELMIVQVMEHVATRIQQLRQEGDSVEGMPPAPPQNPELEEGGPSSNIESFGYDDKTGKLLVRFLGKYPNRQGPIYAYGGVPKQIFDLFQKGAVPARTDGANKWGRWWKGKVPSLGASMYTLIKGGNYPYQRLS